VTFTRAPRTSYPPSGVKRAAIQMRAILLRRWERSAVLLDASPQADSAVLHTIDAVVRERVLVFGSLPPKGRDLDLLVSSPDADAIAARLREDGFGSCGQEWALFHDCTVTKIDLVRASDWNLPADELSALCSEAIVLNGFTNIVEPSPHHTLLILARKLARRRPPLDQKYRARIDTAISKNPEVWEVARRRARLWRAENALAHLESLHARQNHQRRRLRRPSRTRVISLSGVDGAGKSSQAQALQNSLDRLGFNAVVEWTPVHVLNLEFVTRPARKLLGVGAPSRLPDKVNPDFRPSGYPPIVAHSWVAVAACMTAFSLWRSIWQHLGRGKVVICDRYALDFAVFLRYRHGSTQSFRLQTWLLRTLAPKAFCSYFLDVAPEAAFGRKEDQYSLPELQRQADLYRAESARFDVRRLDGEQPPEVLCGDIAADAWRSLKRPKTTP
jgi:thymidylate kinase